LPAMANGEAGCHGSDSAVNYSSESITAKQQAPSKVSYPTTRPYVNMRSWWSLLQAIAHYDSSLESCKDLLTTLSNFEESVTHDSADVRPHADTTTINDKGAIGEGPPVDMQEDSERSFAYLKRCTPLDTVPDASVSAETCTATPHSTKKASASRAVALATSLFTFHNRVNMRVMLIGGRALWSRQSRLAGAQTSMESL